MSRIPRRFPGLCALALILLTLLSACASDEPAARPPLTQTYAQTDREALIALYNTTDGDAWDYNTNWLSDTPLDEWYGVSTDDSGRVIRLDLAKNSLSREIPPELGNLANLRELDLDYNLLSGEILPELGNLANLQELWLSDNQLSGCIPSKLQGQLRDASLGSLTFCP